MEEVFVIAMVGAVNIVIAIFLYGALYSQFERLRDDIRRLEARDGSSGRRPPIGSRREEMRNTARASDKGGSVNCTAWLARR